MESQIVTSKKEEDITSNIVASMDPNQTKRQQPDENCGPEIIAVSSSPGVENCVSKNKLQVAANGRRDTNIEACSSSASVSRTQQPPGESSVSDGLTPNGETNTGRSRSGTELTSYEELEGQLKDNTSEKIPTTSNGNKGKVTSGVTENNGQSDSSAQEESLPPENAVVPTTDIGVQGPPKVISATGTVTVRSVAAPTPSTRSRPGTSLRRGKWTVEEEAYVARVIQDFNSGFLDAPAGTTLRTYLSEKLQCDPMRITKKFTGDACIGKRVFHPAVRSPSNGSAIDKAQMELENLERRWRRRLEMQQRESAKKAAASAAAVAAGRGPHGTSSESSPHELSKSAQEENVVARTASWLDRAKSVLKEPSNVQKKAKNPQAEDLRSQMQEVERLISEGPAIQHTSSGLPEMIDTAEEDEEEVRASSSLSGVEPADKRMRTAEDAEALVGFLRSVRASAAAGNDF